MWPGKGQIRMEGNFLWSKLSLGVILREHEQHGWPLVSHQPPGGHWSLTSLRANGHYAALFQTGRLPATMQDGSMQRNSL